MKLLKLFAAFTLSALCLTGCTYSITMAHTQGSAEDLIDETATNTPTTTANIPVSVVPNSPIPATAFPKVTP